MDWKEFKKLSDDEQIRIFNEVSTEIKHLENTCNALGFKKSTVQSHFTTKLNCVYDSTLNSYIPKDTKDTVKDNKTTKETIKDTAPTDTNKNNKVTDPVVTIEMFNNLVDEFKKLKSEIEELKNSSNINHENNRNENIGVNLEVINSFEYTNTSFRVDKKTMNDFRKFCKSNKFKNISNQALLSLALKEFIENHK